MTLKCLIHEVFKNSKGFAFQMVVTSSFQNICPERPISNSAGKKKNSNPVSVIDPVYLCSLYRMVLPKQKPCKQS